MASSLALAAEVTPHATLSHNMISTSAGQLLPPISKFNPKPAPGNNRNHPLELNLAHSAAYQSNNLMYLYQNSISYMQSTSGSKLPELTLLPHDSVGHISDHWTSIRKSIPNSLAYHSMHESSATDQFTFIFRSLSQILPSTSASQSHSHSGYSSLPEASWSIRSEAHQTSIYTSPHISYYSVGQTMWTLISEVSKSASLHSKHSESRGFSQPMTWSMDYTSKVSYVDQTISFDTSEISYSRSSKYSSGKESDISFSWCASNYKNSMSWKSISQLQSMPTTSASSSGQFMSDHSIGSTMASLSSSERVSNSVSSPMSTTFSMSWKSISQLQSMPTTSVSSSGQFMSDHSIGSTMASLSSSERASNSVSSPMSTTFSMSWKNSVSVSLLSSMKRSMQASISFQFASETHKPSPTPTLMPTSKPTSIPTSVPTGVPSSIPSSIPTSLPTTFPTSQPSSHPTAEPTSQPTNQPSTEPTSQPTNQPTNQPTTEPTSQPTNQPSSEPTVLPSSQPSSKPTLRPTDCPSSFPSTRPSSNPSFSPSSQPSALPTNHPSGLPTSVPSTHPSSIPSSIPTPKPTSQPTSQPTLMKRTAKPTQVGATNPPTSLPSSMPTVNFDLALNNDVYSSYELRMQEQRNSSAFVYGQYMYKGKSFTGSCDTWKQFYQLQLLLPFRFLNFSSITGHYARFDKTTNLITYSNVTCDSKDIVAKIISNWRTGTSYRVTCNKVQWMITSCGTGGGITLCAGCTDACRKSTCPAYETSNFMISPCSSCSGYSTLYSVVSVKVEKVILYPEIKQPIIAETTQNTAELTVNITKAGFVYCAPFSLPPSSGIAIKTAGFSKFSDEPGLVSVRLTGLIPSSKYDVYCYTESKLGDPMDYSAVLKTKTSIQTSCCRRVAFTKYSVQMQEYPGLNPGAPTTFSFALDSLPPQPMTVTVQAISFDTNCPHSMGNLSAITPMPSVFRFSNTSLTSLGSFIIKKSTPGCYILGLYPSLPLVYSGSNISMTIISSSTPPNPPKLSGCIFSNDGTKLVISFDSSTNYAQGVVSSSTAPFACDILFSFSGSTNSICVWSSDQSIVATLSTVGTQANIGDVVTLISGVLKAKCILGTRCDLYEHNSVSSTTIQSPANPVVPKVSLSAPGKISYCSDLVLDPTSSFGNAGRGWAAVVWKVKGENSGNITNFLNNTRSTGDLVTISNTLFKPGQYELSLQLTNFLRVSSIATIMVTVTQDTSTPMVTISGPSSISMKRPQPLTIFAMASLPTCGRSTATPKLTYSWLVYKGESTTPLTINSVALDPRYFKLNAFSLDSSELYTIQVKVSNNGAFSTAVVSVQVGQSGINAVIAGGATRTVQLSEGAKLDASQSSSLDYPGTINGLKFQWGCMDTTPSRYGSDCTNVNFTANTAATHVDFQNILMPEDSSTASYTFTVLVSNAVGISSSATVVLTVTSTAIPEVSIGTIQTKYNSDSKIVLTGLVNTKLRSTKYMWSSDSYNSSVLQSLSLTPISNILTASAQVSVIQLSLASNSLTPGLSYSFTLGGSFDRTATTFTASTQVTVLINEPPRDGVLIVKPTTGVALNTTFFLLTKYWLDDPSDYPLNYIMDYYSLSATSANVLKSIGQIPYVSAFLGQGLASQGFNVTCRVQALDIYSSSASTISVIQVKEMKVSTELLSSSLESAFSASDPAAVSQVINAVTAAINTVDCSKLPVDCPSLNRQDCSATANTCGSCLPGYLGPTGDSNVKCQSRSEVRRVGNDCENDEQCITGYCKEQICSYKSKSCINQCTSVDNGDCVFYDVLTDNVLTDCLENDETCQAKCVCKGVYKGSDCSLDNSAFLLKLKMRETLCISLYKTISIQDISKDVILSRATTISGVFSDIQQITMGALTNCTAALVESVKQSPSISGSDGVSDVIGSALSSVLEKGNSLPTELLQNVSSAMSDLTAGVQNSLAVGEPPKEITTKNARVSVSLADPSNPQPLSPPQNDYEKFNNVPVTAIDLDTSSSEAGAVGASIMQYTSISDQTLTARAVGIQTTSYEVDSTGRRRLTDSSSSFGMKVLLQNLKPKYYSSFNASYDLECKIAGAPYNLSVPCGSSNRSVECSGIEYYPLHYSCAEEQHPSCQVSIGDSTRFSDDGSCEVESYTPHNTTCVCSGGNRRRLALNAQSSSPVKQIAASATTIGTDFANRWKSAKNLSLSAVQKNLVITITMASILGLTIFGVLRLIFLDMKEHKANHEANVKRKKRVRRRLRDFFNGIMPNEFSGLPWYRRFYDKLLLEHDWLCILLPYNPERDYRTVRWVCCMVRVINFLFIDTILSGMFFADDGTCQTYATESTCTAIDSLDQVSPMCVWSDTTGCSFNQNIGGTFISAMILTTIITTISIPFDNLAVGMVFRVRDYIRGLMLAHNFSEKVHIEHELTTLQTVQCTFLRAAKLVRMQQLMDEKTPSEEVDVLMSDGKKVDEIISSGMAGEVVKVEPTAVDKIVEAAGKNLAMDEEIGDPLRAAVTVKRHSTGSRGTIIRKIKKARLRAKKIERDMMFFDTDYEQEVYLIRSFLVNCMSGFQRRIAYRFFFSANDDRDESKKIWQLVSVAVLPLYIISLSFYIFLFGVSIGSKATNTWLLGSFVSFAQDVILLQPFKIWMKWIVVTAAATQSLAAWHRVLRDRSRHIMLRKEGLLRTANDLIQHFNPACRAARKFPHLPSSRLLMSLSDFDLPAYRLLVVRSKYDKIFGLFFILSAIVLFILMLMPEIIQDSLLEVVITSVVNFSVVAIAFLSQIEVGLPVLVFVILVGLILTREYILMKQRRKSKAYVVPIDNDIVEDVSTYDEPVDDDLNEHYDGSVKNKPVDKNSLLYKLKHRQNRIAATFMDVVSEGRQQNSASGEVSLIPSFRNQTVSIDSDLDTSIEKIPHPQITRMDSNISEIDADLQDDVQEDNIIDIIRGVAIDTHQSTEHEEQLKFDAFQAEPKNNLDSYITNLMNSSPSSRRVKAYEIGPESVPKFSLDLQEMYSTLLNDSSNIDSQDNHNNNDVWAF